MPIELRPYQLEISHSVLKSIYENSGYTFSVEIARQGGKNELSAQMEVALLTLNAVSGGNIIKCAPTFKPQTIISMTRLQQRLLSWGLAGAYKVEHGYIIRLGNANCVFLSADSTASVVGNTAHILLEVDESQDVDKEKYTKEFKPMGATTNVTTVHYGTTWDDSTLLEEVKQANIELERKDKIRRHFAYDWTIVAESNPIYAKYVMAERDRLGESHPLFQTQYCLNPIRGGGRMFNPAQLQSLHGSHERTEAKKWGTTYIAALDIAGEAEVTDEEIIKGDIYKRDSTVLSIGELIYPKEDNTPPELRIAAIYSWVGMKHPTIFPLILDLVRDQWKAQRFFIDATGIGEPVASHFAKALGKKAVPFKFTQSSKSELAFDLLSITNGARLKMYTTEDQESREFWHQFEKAKSLYRPNQTMGFDVDPSEGHDDVLMSVALLVQASKQFKRTTAKGR